MAIVDSDLQYFYPLVINDLDTNGGRMSHNPITTGLSENVFQNAPKAERLAGSEKFRKVFCKVNSDSSDTLFYPKVYFHAVTPVDDRAHFVVSTQRGTKADLTGSEDKFGAAVLVSHSGTTLVVDVEDADLTDIFRDDIEIIVSDKATPTSGTGNEEVRTVADIVSVVGVRVTITMDSALTNTYAAGSKVASIYGLDAIACTVDNWVETSSTGTYDEGTNPLVMNNRGTVEQTWTLTFLTATTFAVVGDTVGSVGSGSTSADFAPNNTNFTKPYFTLASAGFGGTWAGGDTIVFQTHPIAIPIFEIRDIDADTGPLGTDLITLVFTGEV